MAGEGAKKAEEEATPAAPEASKDVAEEKAVIPAPPPQASKPENKKPPADDSKALVVVEKVAEKPHAEKNTQRSSNDRDIALAKVETEKRNSLIKAWEENEKAKAENNKCSISLQQRGVPIEEIKCKTIINCCLSHKAAKKLSAILSWENTKKAAIEAQLKRKEEELEKKKAAYAEKMKNKAAIAHKEAEEKRATVVARRGKEAIKAEEMAAKYRTTGLAPKKLLGCFGA